MKNIGHKGSETKFKQAKHKLKKTLFGILKEDVTFSQFIAETELTTGGQTRRQKTPASPKELNSNSFDTCIYFHLHFIRMYLSLLKP